MKFLINFHENWSNIYKIIKILVVMKKFILFAVFSFISFVGVSQEDTSVVDIRLLFPKLFSGCNDSVVKSTKIFFIPLSTDLKSIGFFNDDVSATFSNGIYEVGVIRWNTTTKYVSDIWVEVTDGENLIMLPLCEINQAFESGVLFSEYEKVFNYINNNYKKIWGYEK
jgi:hypothetical protein